MCYLQLDLANVHSSGYTMLFIFSLWLKQQFLFFWFFFCNNNIIISSFHDTGTILKLVLIQFQIHSQQPIFNTLTIEFTLLLVVEFPFHRWILWNVIFLKNVVYVLNEWPLILFFSKFPLFMKGLSSTQSSKSWVKLDRIFAYSSFMQWERFLRKKLYLWQNSQQKLSINERRHVWKRYYFPHLRTHLE